MATTEEQLARFIIDTPTERVSGPLHDVALNPGVQRLTVERVLHVDQRP